MKILAVTLVISSLQYSICFQLRTLKLKHFREIVFTFRGESDKVNDNSVKSLRDRRREKRLTQREDHDALNSQSDIFASKNTNIDPKIFPTPEHMKADEITYPHIKFISFDELFPNTNIGEIFDNNLSFRNDIRSAAREDFFVYDPNLSSKANSFLKDPSSTLMSNWQRENEIHHLTKTFQNYNININGKTFINTLSNLCGKTDNIFGSWIDIIGIRNKKVNYSWHQDSGLNQFTVMVGFPPSNNFIGTGVFSHAIKLSHRMIIPTKKEPRLWEYGDITEEYIIRPIYKRGMEVMVYNDMDIYHSAPDSTNRESIWRFM
eukprot:gene6317-12779_t